MRAGRWTEARTGGKNPGKALPTGGNGGRVLGPVEHYGRGKTGKVRATLWRSELLGLRIRTGTQEAKDASVKYMPLRIRGLELAMESIGQAMRKDPLRLHDLTDAAGVTEYGVVRWLENERKR